MAYIEFNLDDSFDMRAFQNSAAASEGCRALGLPEHPVDQGYHYLLTLSQLSLVHDNVVRFRTKAQTLRNELERLQALTPDEVWRQELLMLKDTLLQDDRYGSP
jgi:hypothetical protein